MIRRLSIYSWMILSGWVLASCTYQFYPAACDHPLPGMLQVSATLDSSLSETSGLLYLGGIIWSFNDSGGEAALYGFDPRSGQVLRKVSISNASNVDWEDIAADLQYIYVGDVGNNFAGRDTVVIYRISKNSLLSGDPEILHEGIISLSFEEEILKNPGGYSSHDCEALMAYGDSLYLFSKNWVDESTSVFVVPATPGHYRRSQTHSYPARLLVTGADLHSSSRQVALVGYHNYMPVVITYEYGENPGSLACGGKARVYPLRRGRQVEGICFDPGGNIFISSEQSIRKQTLFKLGGSVQ
jgi:hypothetical protein